MVPPQESASTVMGGVLCLVGLLIRLGRTIRWGASDLLAVKLLLLHFHQDTIALHNDTEPVLEKYKSGEVGRGSPGGGEVVINLYWMTIIFHVLERRGKTSPFPVAPKVQIDHITHCVGSDRKTPAEVKQRRCVRLGQERPGGVPFDSGVGPTCERHRYSFLFNHPAGRRCHSVIGTSDFGEMSHAP